MNTGAAEANDSTERPPAHKVISLTVRGWRVELSSDPDAFASPPGPADKPSAASKKRPRTTVKTEKPKQEREPEEDNTKEVRAWLLQILQQHIKLVGRDSPELPSQTSLGSARAYKLMRTLLGALAVPHNRGTRVAHVGSIGELHDLIVSNKIALGDDE